MRLLLFLVISLVIGSLAEDTKACYDYYHVYRITPDNESQIQLLREMDAGSDSILFLYGIHSVHKDVDVIVAPHKAQDFEIILQANELKFSLISNNLQAGLQDETSLKLNVYNSFDDANNWLHTLPDAYPGIVTIETYGRSYEDRELNCVKISFSNTKKDAIFVEAGMHGNEWIAPATALYLINELLTTIDADIVKLARHYNWYIIPHVNPDGFEYSRAVDRMWRKTRKRYGNYYGANMNRNFGADWGQHDANRHGCSSSFIGAKVESEIESEKLVSLVKRRKEEVKLYISLHGYGQRIEYPHDTSDSTLKLICGRASAAMSTRYDSYYICSNKFNVLEKEAGNFLDWVYGYTKDKRTLAYSYKLRPLERSFETGFVLEEKQIVPTGKEFLDSLVAMIAAAEQYNYLQPNNAVPPTTARPPWFHDEVS